MADELNLLPCPFCGLGGAKAGAHKEDCYFSLSAAIRTAPKGDLTLVPDILAAWNRRAPSTSTAPTDEQTEQEDKAYNAAVKLSNIIYNAIQWDHLPETWREGARGALKEWDENRAALATKGSSNG